MNKQNEVDEIVNECIKSKKYVEGIIYLKQIFFLYSPRKNWHTLYNKLNHYRFVEKIDMNQRTISLYSFQKFCLLVGIAFLFFLFFKLFPIFVLNLENLVENHFFNVVGGFSGLPAYSINLDFSSISKFFPPFRFYYLPFGNMFLIVSIIYLKKTSINDSMIAFLNLFIVFLLFEAILLFFHLNMKYDPLYAELLFYGKFFVLNSLFFWLTKNHYNLLLRITLIISVMLLLIVEISLLLLKYYDVSFTFYLTQASILGTKSSIPLIKYLYLKIISLFIYLQYILPLFFLTLNLVIVFHYYVNKEKYLKNYQRIVKRLDTKYLI